MKRESLFSTPQGGSYVFTFILVSSLFLLWGFCNGMIDVMDKHFQVELHLTLSQSAWVQFAHYLGYFLMALPAGWLASKLGYKGGIVAGLLMVAVGGFWFIPATQIASFWAFLLGVCVIAAGLTFLETVANPYATVLGPKPYAAARINLAQSCNGVGWVFGPIAGSMFFYSTNAEGQSTGAETLWIPYVAVAVVVLILAVVFLKARVPDINTEDDYNLDEESSEQGVAVPRRGLSLLLLWLNIAVLSASVAMIGSAVSTLIHPEETHVLRTFVIVALSLLTIGTLVLFIKSRSITPHSIWMHPHFSGATITQFFYVAAQAGIFGFFINYLTVSKSGHSQVPPIPAAWDSFMNQLALSSGPLKTWLMGWFEATPEGLLHISDKGAANLASVAFICFLVGRFFGAMIMKKVSAHKVLAVFGFLNVVMCVLVFAQLGWVSVACVFLSYFFMSIMFPTIFALGIFGLGQKAKKAAAFIVMAIMGGAIMPKLMGHVADVHGIGHSFAVPLVCFAVVGCYALFWSKLSNATETGPLKTSGGH